MLSVLAKTGNKNIAEIYVAKVRGNDKYLVEFVDASPEPESSRLEKWVIIVSSQVGCAARCKFCDASEYYYGNLSVDELMEQVDYIFRENSSISPDSCRKLKVQFARMGEPAFNPNIIPALDILRERAPAFIPCIATIAPAGTEDWFEDLLSLKDKFRDFQLQFSINSSEAEYRDRLMPVKKMDFPWISEYGRRFHDTRFRKIALNFACSESIPLFPEKISEAFDPAIFCVKLTPLNPTINGFQNKLKITEDPADIELLLHKVRTEFAARGFDVIVSIGDLRENELRSNCGQTVYRFLNPDGLSFTRYET